MLFKAFNSKGKQEKGETDSSYIYSHTHTHTHTTKHLTLLTKGKRSQSALEYMMTYGWAILIIVIVAVILYSMGIFNPSSSVTFTSSGFSPFTVSSSLCNNIGYKIAVIAGPIPNNANSLTINKVFVTSATGANATTASYTLTNPVTLKSGQSATILIPNVACNAANVHYSLSAKIEYSYTAGTLGLQYVNTSGTVAGTSITGKPSVLTAYEPITITNSQSSATPNPFQQMINFTSSDPGFSSIATGNFGQNVEFFYYNGTVIPSWLENYTSTNAIWWLKLGNIPAGSSETIYVGFAPTSTNLFNTVNDGEAPQLSSTYAEYDDGANVFNNYWNFAGISLPSPFIILGNKTELTINNGITLNSSGSFISIETNTVFPIDNILEINLINPIISNEFSNGGGIMYALSRVDGIYNSTGVAVNGQGQWIYGGCTTSVLSGAACNFSLAQIGQQKEGIAHNSVEGSYGMVGNLTKSEIMGVVSESTGTYIYKNEAILNSTTTVPPEGNYYIVVGAGGDLLSSKLEFSFNWLRTRAYPPNGVMPSVTFGSVA